VIVCETSDPDATRDLAAQLAARVHDGDLIVLIGDLGAGKTAFAQGFARALGVTDPVTSPTFTLANRYEGRLVVNHLDAYRVEVIAEARDLALPELLDDGVTLIEWGDVISPALPNERLEIRITFGEGDDDRRLEISPLGTGWVARERELTAALGDWRAN
jgi:tRNA threonylcarbamoyladenosine biosynthesis protein TsaE